MATGEGSSLIPQSLACAVHSSWDTSAVREQSRGQWQIFCLRQHSALGQELKETVGEAILAEGRSRTAKSEAVRLQQAPDATQPYRIAQVDGA